VDETPVLATPSLEIYPNPVNEFSHIRYTLPEQSHVQISIVDISGREIQTITNESKSAGIYENNIEKESLKPGIYFCKINIGGVIRTEKMVVSQ
jgi:hypothetical protein